MNQNERRQKYDKIFKIALVALGALIISPIIFLVVKGVVGLAIAALVGLIVVNAAPVISMKLANMKVRGIVNEARENPIETLTNLLIEKRRALDTFRDVVTGAVNARNTFERQCKEFSKQYPARAQEFTTQLAQMSKSVEQKKAALQTAISAIALGEDKLKEAQAYYSMAMALQVANKAANMDTGDVFAALKADTAIESVMNNVGLAFAEMEVESTVQNVALENNPSPVLGTVVNVNSRVVL